MTRWEPYGAPLWDAGSDGDDPPRPGVSTMGRYTVEEGVHCGPVAARAFRNGMPARSGRALYGRGRDRDAAREAEVAAELAGIRAEAARRAAAR